MTLFLVFNGRKSLFHYSPAGQGLRADLQQPTKQQERYTQAHLRQI